MPLITKRFEPIHPDEEKWHEIDFAAALDPGDTIASVVWSAAEYDVEAQAAGADAAAILDGSESHTATLARHFISGCTAGTVYRLAALATTAAGAVHHGAGLLYCEGD